MEIMTSITDMQIDQGSEITDLLQEDSSPLPDLPQEIIVDILSRIPVKSLLKFRCVSKSWRYWISTPHFIKSHLAKSIQNKKYANHSLLLIPMDASADLHACPLDLILYYQKSQVKPVKLQFPMQNPYPRLSLAGCCNGLFCIRESHGIILWNPSTRESKNLPYARAHSPNYRYITCGFGYDEAHDDYKVVDIGYCWRQEVKLETVVNLYRLRTNSWRRIQENQRGVIVSSSPGVFVNGALHWLVLYMDGSKNPWRILSLNVSELSYGEIVQPRYEDGSFNLTLGVLEGCLCFFCNYDGIRMR